MDRVAASTPWSSFCRRIRGRKCVPWRASRLGGELSRVMLALRTLAASDAAGRTLVFDEVDAGIGGAAADAVGARLQALGRRYQVLCVTHLPQIAARGGTHFEIGKQIQQGRTVTLVKKLDQPGREAEIGRMIAGVEVSPQVLASAGELAAQSRKRSKHERRKRKSPAGESEGPPWRVSTVIETFGCQMNFHDSERLAGLLESEGYEPAEDAADADLVVLNTCSVRERAEDKLLLPAWRDSSRRPQHGTRCP